MTLHLGNVDASIVLYIPFHTFDSNGASITITGLATSDILVYKNGSVTQRSSTNGYTLLDTDGIDFDGLTGIHGFSIDLADNTDAGFYVAGSFYWVVVSAITVDTRTVSFVVATFRIGPAAVNATQILGTAISTPATAGILDVNVKNIDNDAASASGTVTFPNATLASTTNITAGTITTVTNLTNAATSGDLTATMKASVNTEADTALTDYDGPTNAELATALGTADDATLAAIAALNNLSQANIRTAVGLASANLDTQLTAIDDAVDTEVASILAAVDTEVAAIKAKTDQLTFTSANHVDSNVQKVNDVTLQGDGSATPWGPA